MRHEIKVHASVIAKKNAPRIRNATLQSRPVPVDSDDECESTSFDAVFAPSSSVAPTACPPRQPDPPPPQVHQDATVTIDDAAPPHPNPVVPFSLPEPLRILGNKRAWNALHTHLLERPSDPCIISGPTGCGKTAGVACLLRAMQITPVMLDAVEADDTHQLTTWIKRTRDSKSFGGRRAVVLDDMEGFTEKARDAIVVLSRDNTSGRAPLILVVNNVRDPLWKRINTLTTFRLFPPNQHVAHEWFANHQQWSRAGDDGVMIWHTGFSGGILDTATSVMGCGDLRRIYNHLSFSATTGLEYKGDNDSFPTNIFDASRRLFKRTTTAADWATFAEPRDVHLLQYHTTNAVSDIYRLANALDTFSDMDAHRPLRYEHTGTFDHYNAFSVASSTRLFTNPSRDVGALFPPPLPNREKRPQDTENPIDALNRCGWR